MKRKILIVQPVAGYLDGQSFGFTPGTVEEVSEELAQAWVASGIASWPSKEKPKAETAVAKAPEAAKVVVPEVKVESKPEPKVETKDEPTETK